MTIRNDTKDTNNDKIQLSRFITFFGAFVFVEPEVLILSWRQVLLIGWSSQVKESLIEAGFGMDIKGRTWRPNTLKDVVISLLATYAGRAVDMKEWMENSQINTDRNLRLQYLAGMSVNLSMNTEILKGILKYYEFPEDIFSGSSQRVQEMKLALQTANRTS